MNYRPEKDNGNTKDDGAVGWRKGRRTQGQGDANQPRFGGVVAAGDGGGSGGKEWQSENERAGPRDRFL